MAPVAPLSDALTDAEWIERAACHTAGLTCPGQVHAVLRGLGLPPAQTARLLTPIEQRVQQLLGRAAPAAPALTARDVTMGERWLFTSQESITALGPHEVRA